MEAPLGFLPKARRQGIITKEVDGELLIYDLDRDKAHCLNPSAATIWKLCDGKTTTEAIARQLGGNSLAQPQARQSHSRVTGNDGAAAQGAVQFDERIVWLAIAELRKRHLLEASDKELWPQTLLGMSRREAVKWIGIGAALPVVISITAPTARANVSNCFAKCALCDTGTDCCSGQCFSTNIPDCPADGEFRCT